MVGTSENCRADWTGTGPDPEDEEPFRKICQFPTGKVRAEWSYGYRSILSHCGNNGLDHKALYLRNKLGNVAGVGRAAAYFISSLIHDKCN